MPKYEKYTKEIMYIENRVLISFIFYFFIIFFCESKYISLYFSTLRTMYSLQFYMVLNLLLNWWVYFLLVFNFVRS